MDLDFDSCGPSLLVENYGYSCTFPPEAEVDDPTQVKWEWARARQNKGVSYDPSLEWKCLSNESTQELERHHAEGFFYTGEENCYIEEDFGLGPPARTTVYENSIDATKPNLMTVSS